MNAISQTITRAVAAVGAAGLLLAAAATAKDNVASPSVADLGNLDLAQLMQIEIPTVVGASKHEQKTTEAPASVTIVTRDDIQKFGYRNMADILRGVPGFYITQDGSQ